MSRRERIVSDKDEILISDNLFEGARDDEDEDDITDEEIEEAEKNTETDEKILAIIQGNVDGRGPLNRLAVTDSRIIFYPKGGIRAAFSKVNAVSVNFDQIITVEGKKGRLLGEIGVSTKGNIFRFKDMAKDDVDQIAGMILRRKDKAKSQQVGGVTREGALDQLKKLAELKSMGAISEEEFQEKKSKLMERI